MRRRDLVLWALLLVATTAYAALRIPIRAAGEARLALAQEGIPLPVIMYHHLRERGGLGQDVITPSAFEGDLNELARRGYTTVTLANLLAYQREGVPLPERPILITFDDGFQSVHHYATPLLEARGMHAILFVLTSATDFYQAVPAIERSVTFAYLDWEELAELAASPSWEIGNHTHALHHPTADAAHRKGALPRKGESQEDYLHALQTDIGGAQQRIADHCGLTPVAFAYPYGFHSDRADEALTKMGFPITVITERGVSRITRDPASLHDIKRINRPHGVTSADFFDRLEKLLGEA